jgi:hypothetical protein
MLIDLSKLFFLPLFPQTKPFHMLRSPVCCVCGVVCVSCEWMCVAQKIIRIQLSLYSRLRPRLMIAPYHISVTGKMGMGMGVSVDSFLI